MRVLLVSSNTERITLVTFLDLLPEADAVAAVHRAVARFAADVR